MKKYLIALLLGSLLVLAVVATVTADNGPHGSFTATTDACAGCHRVHTATYGSNALLITDPEALCESCHDGSGAATNVVDGVYALAGSPSGSTEGVDGGSLFAGGFTNALMATAWSGAYIANPAFNAVSRPTTSVHDVGVSGTVWGSGGNNTAHGGVVLECTSCHDPHGTAGWLAPVAPATTWTKVASYRLLRWQPSGSGGFTPPVASVNWSGGAFPSNGSTTGWLVPDNYAANGAEWYTIGSQLLSTCGTPAVPCGPFAVGDYNNGNANSAYRPLNAAGVEQTYVPAAVNTAYFCAQCHDRYFNNSRLRNHTDQSVFCGHPLNGTTVVGTATLPYLPDADGVAPWIHPVDPVRCLANVDASNNILTWGDNGSSGDTTYMYRHSSGDVRASMDLSVNAGTGATVSRSCVACHVAHGTAADMTALADTASLATGSVLLRMDNRSVCLRCHANTVNFVVGP